ncbi:HTH domain-containing protein [Bifidobacterium lemurum]|nr:HTH domain-containing protein [Bifidobacterium lemurum]
MFTSEEMAYLGMLPVVRHVTHSRISYTHDFKVDCLRAYLSGESPTAIFRKVGLDPSLVGAKRIERCFARWKQSPDLVEEAQLRISNDTGPTYPGLDESVSPYDISRVTLPNSNGKKVDLRDLIIYQQSLHIHELEQEISRLRSVHESMV